MERRLIYGNSFCTWSCAQSYSLVFFCCLSSSYSSFDLLYFKKTLHWPGYLLYIKKVKQSKLRSENHSKRCFRVKCITFTIRHSFGLGTVRKPILGTSSGICVKTHFSMCLLSILHVAEHSATVTE